MRELIIKNLYQKFLSEKNVIERILRSLITTKSDTPQIQYYPFFLCCPFTCILYTFFTQIQIIITIF